MITVIFCQDILRKSAFCNPAMSVQSSSWLTEFLQRTIAVSISVTKSSIYYRVRSIWALVASYRQIHQEALSLNINRNRSIIASASPTHNLIFFEELDADINIWFSNIKIWLEVCKEGYSVLATKYPPDMFDFRKVI